MCGEIKKATTVAEAADWAIAYAMSFEGLPGYGREGDPLPDNSKRRAIASEFVSDFVPAALRELTFATLDRTPNDKFTSDTSYWTTVVDQSVGGMMRAIGTRSHDTFDDYETSKERNKHSEFARYDDED